MASVHGPNDDAHRDAIKDLQFTLFHAQRLTDRFIRLYHRAKDETVKPRWLALAKRNDELAADAARKLREALDRLP